MVLRGDIERPDPFLVMRADPGMENQESREFAFDIEMRCKLAGIDFITAPGPNLYADLVTFKERGVTRIDNPPYWTRNRETGRLGQMKQKCTGVYKIAPMRRALRTYLHEKFGVSLVTKRLPKVETWIGYAAHEQHRVKESNVKYITLRYPLIEGGWDSFKTEWYYRENGITKPPRSVCNACFANGLVMLEDMYRNRPADWDQAVEVDDAIRDMRSVGIKDEVFVSSTLVPLRDLPAMGFKKADANYVDHKCNSGVCFL